MELYYDSISKSYTFAIQNAEAEEVVDLNRLCRNIKNNPDEAKEMLEGLGGFFCSMLVDLTGAVLPQTTKCNLSIGGQTIHYTINTTDTECRTLGNLVIKDLNIRDEFEKYARSMVLSMVREAVEEISDSPQLNFEDFDEEEMYEEVEDEYFLVFKDIDSVIGFCKAFPRKLLNKTESELFKTEDGLVLKIWIMATQKELTVLSLDGRAIEWDGYETTKIYESFEEFQIEDPLKTLAEL